MDKARQHDTESDLQRALSLFKCTKDLDIQNFIYENAIEFENRKQCKVYLILDEEQFDQGVISVQAYFTLSHRALEFGEYASKTSVKRIAGYKDRTSESVVLIGQLGKYIDGQYSSPITLSEILEKADEIIYQANELIPCRAVMVECTNEVHEKGLYLQEGFRFLQQDGSLFQYYKPIR